MSRGHGEEVKLSRIVDPFVLPAGTTGKIARRSHVIRHAQQTRRHRDLIVVESGRSYRIAIHPILPGLDAPEIVPRKVAVLAHFVPQKIHPDRREEIPTSR